MTLNSFVCSHLLSGNCSLTVDIFSFFVYNLYSNHGEASAGEFVPSEKGRERTRRVQEENVMAVATIEIV